MPLRQGSKGPDVVALQRALEGQGFDPGAFDGDFGPGTESVLRDFQAARGLSVDGIAGPASLAALGIAAPPSAAPLADITARITPARVAHLFPGALIGDIARNLPLVLAALSKAGLGDRAMVLMALATIRCEVASFRPEVEGVSRWNSTEGRSDFDLYDNRRDLGNGPAPDGARFRGRGFVQLTGRANYTFHGGVIGQPLAVHPELAAEPAIAATLLASFLNTRAAKIRAALADNDLVTARRLVNGGAHGLEAFIDCYRRGLMAIPA